MINLSKETSEDWWEVENLYDLAFGPGREGLSSYRLRENVPPVSELCLVARGEDGILGGAIRYWPISISGMDGEFLLLGPIAVHPTRQGEGLGSVLMAKSMEIATKSDWSAIILIGDAPYYRRFGFEKAPNLRFPPPTNPDRLLAKTLRSDPILALQGMIIPFKPVASV